MFTKLQTIRHSQGLQQSAITIGGSLIAAGLSAIATLIITRKLGPEEFGIFSVGFALVQILVRVTDFGMTAVVQRFAGGETDREEINTFFSFTTKVRLITWIVLCLTGLLFGNLIADLLNFQYPEIIVISFILTGATYFYEHFQAMLQAIQRFGQSAFVNISQSFLKALLSLLLIATVPLTTFWVFCGYMVAPVVPFILYKKLFPSWVHITNTIDLKSKAQTVFQFARHAAVGFICAGIIENVDILFVQKYLTTYEAGLLGGANKVALLFSVIAYSLASVLNPRVAKYKTKHDIQAYSKKACLILAASLVGIVAFIPLAKPVLLLTIGEAYLPALPILIVLVASSLLSVAAVPFIALFFSFNKASYFSISGIVQVAIILVGNALFVPEYGLDAAAWTRLWARIALLVLTITMAWWVYKHEYEKTS
jgi:O-antigen/teichoic acid export membrane protein